MAKAVSDKRVELDTSDVTAATDVLHLKVRWEGKLPVITNFPRRKSALAIASEINALVSGGTSNHDTGDWDIDDWPDEDQIW